MNLQHLEIVDAVALVGAVGGTLLALTTLRARRLVQRSYALNTVLSARVAALEQQVEMLSRQVSDSGRRLDWLEVCERERAASQRSDRRKDAKGAASAAATTDSLSITERRHRVLTLAKRGLQAEQIADTLGVPHGEVELIISLNTAA